MKPLLVHSFQASSRGNGPGERAVLWLQGCTLGCVGCFNPGTHEKPGRERDPLQLAQMINALPARGLTLSGGEPLQQAEAVGALLAALSPDKDVLLYTGYTLAECRKAALRRAVLLRCDAALMGRYDHSKPHPYQGKELMIRTGRIQPEELLPRRGIEFLVHGNAATLTGFPLR